MFWKRAAHLLIFSSLIACAVCIEKAFAKKRIVLTGCSSGIGAEAALQLAKCGAELVIAARRAELLEAVAKKCVAAGAVVLAHLFIHSLMRVAFGG